MKPLHVPSWDMKSWRGIWSPSKNCFQKRNCILMSLFKNKLQYLYQCSPSQILSGRSGYKTLWAKNILQQHYKERPANESRFAVGGLSARGKGEIRSPADQWNWDTKAEVEKLSRFRLNPWTGGQALINKGNNSGTTRYFLPALFQVSHAQRTD